MGIPTILAYTAIKCLWDPLAGKPLFREGARGRRRGPSADTTLAPTSCDKHALYDQIYHFGT